MKEREPCFIECEELVKIYAAEEKKIMALQGLDLKVTRGEMLAIIGKSGSGKSTLLNLLGGLETPTAGRLLVNGRDLSSYREREMVRYRQTEVGFVWQKSERNLFPYLTAIQNIMAPMIVACGKGKKDHALSLLKQVGMERHANKYPAELSGGEQQRVAIAVALANNPSILLADEPTGAVDTATANQIFQLFHRLNRETGITILVVTHDMGLSDKVERTVMISDGKISTEKIQKSLLSSQALRQWEGEFEKASEEYVVLDRARRLQLSEEVLWQAGIHTNRVRVEVKDGKVILRP